MTKVTYLFGAGASANALPVVDQLPNRINDLIGCLIDESRREKLLLSENEYFPNLGNNSKRGYQNQLIEDLKWVSDQAFNHASVDTYAKKLFLKHEREVKNLKRLKTALSVFFVLEQARNKIDKRYDSFFASILKNDVFDLPNNINILSWNYDYQFEKAFSGFSDEANLDKNQGLLHVITKFTALGFSTKDLFSIIKLNGTTGFSAPVKEMSYPIQHSLDLSAKFDVNLIDSLVMSYAQATENIESIEPMLSFAWEPVNSGNINVVSEAIGCTGDTNILVVIGYSFPFFNRDVDRRILGQMRNLRKVYIQAPGIHAENTKTRFLAIRSDLHLPRNLVTYDEVQSFLLPDELEL